MKFLKVPNQTDQVPVPMSLCMSVCFKQRRQPHQQGVRDGASRGVGFSSLCLSAPGTEVPVRIKRQALQALLNTLQTRACSVRTSFEPTEHRRRCRE